MRTGLLGLVLLGMWCPQVLAAEAIHEFGWDRIIMVMNTAFGLSPTSHPVLAYTAVIGLA